MSEDDSLLEEFLEAPFSDQVRFVTICLTVAVFVSLPELLRKVGCAITGRQYRPPGKRMGERWEDGE